MNMMRPGETVDYVPLAERGKPEAARVVYTLRCPLVYDRVKLESAVGQKGGRHHSTYDLLDRLRRDVEEVMAGSEDAEQRDRLLGMILAHEARLRAFHQRVFAGELDFDKDDEEGRQRFLAELRETEESASTLQEIEDNARTLGRRYARAEADNAVYADIYGIEAARLCLTGWRGLPADFARGPQGVADAVLAQIPPAHLQEIGAEVRRLMLPDQAAEKNSAGPSSGDSAGKPSTARKPRTKKSR